MVLAEGEGLPLWPVSSSLHLEDTGLFCAMEETQAQDKDGSQAQTHANRSQRYLVHGLCRGQTDERTEVFRIAGKG
jgi:hypothetical protein